MDKPEDKNDSGSGAPIEDIAQITNAVMGHLRANPETQKRTDNVIQVFLGGAIAALDDGKKVTLKEEYPGAPPEAMALANYVEMKKKELMAAGYAEAQATNIIMTHLGMLSVYAGIANNEKKIAMVRRVMAQQIRNSAQTKEQEKEKSPKTTMGKASTSHRDQARFAMKGRGSRTRS